MREHVRVKADILLAYKDERPHSLPPPIQKCQNFYAFLRPF